MKITLIDKNFISKLRCQIYLFGHKQKYKHYIPGMHCRGYLGRDSQKRHPVTRNLPLQDPPNRNNGRMQNSLVAS